MIQGSLARRYAKALFTIAREDGRVEEVNEEMQTFAHLMEVHRDLREVFTSPTVTHAERDAVIVHLAERARLSDVVTTFLRLVSSRRRTRFLPDMAEAYKAMADEHAGRVRAHVVTAAPLTDAQQDRIRQSLAGATGKTVALSHEDDPSLLGGVIARVGNRLYDSSIKTHLARLKAEMAGEHM